MSLGLEVAVGFLQVFGIRLEGERRPQDTLGADGGGDIHFLAVQPRMFFVGQDIGGEVVGALDGRADQTVVAQPEFEAFPIGFDITLPQFDILIPQFNTF